MNIQESTESYEAWLGKQLTSVPKDLKKKHAYMTEALFPFLRATFYRWMQTWPEVCPTEHQAPQVLAVGDIHVENFGTWRDGDGRLIWGVNDFDEAYELPYTLDLTRLAVSAHVAIQSSQLRIGTGDACDSILEGYKVSLDKRGRPFVLEERHTWLRDTVTGELRDPVRFWAKFDKLKPLTEPIPESARKAIEALLPEPLPPYFVFHRIAGLGSLGRQRFAAVAESCGGKLAREAKAMAPSACAWAAGVKGAGAIRYPQMLRQAIRAADPFLQLKGRWVLRRLSPHCSRIELSGLPAARDEKHLLRSMGYELANIHLGTADARSKILRDLSTRRGHWLHEAAAKMFEQTNRDWIEWRKRPL